MVATSVKVGDAIVGSEHPPLFLADIGTFFNQDVDRGLSLIDRVADTGLAIIKGEILHDASICIDSPLRENISSRAAEITQESYRDVIARKALPLSVYERLCGHARNRGLKLALSVYDFTGLRFAIDQDAALIKIASSNIVHRPLIEASAACGVPVMIDTGGASMDEIARATTWFTAAGGTQLIVEYSPPAPPAPPSRHNLRMMATMREAFRCPVGLSDHHHGTEMLFAAVALGADVLEKGVFPDDLEREQDLAHGLPISELPDVIRRIGNVTDALNGPMPMLPGSAAGHPARMGLVASRDLAVGHVLTRDDVTFAFPAIGVPVEQIGDAIGRQLTTAIARGTPIPPTALRGRGSN